MDRYNEVKLLLKSWEQEFLQQHQRKPGKEDIDQAPEDTRRLYKEYRSLKQAKGNCNNDASVIHGAEINPAPKIQESDSWGAHLNRKAMPVSAPRLTSQEKASLMTSSQYYGLKLKSNLSTISKERPVSLKKSHRTGRVPLNSLKDDQAAQNNSLSLRSVAAKTSAEDPKQELLSPRGMKPPFGSVASKTLRAAEPEEPFKPFKPDPGDAVNSCHNGNSVNDSQNEGIASQLQIVETPFAATSSPPLSSLSRRCVAETTGREDGEENSHSESPVSSVGPGAPVAVKRSPPFLAGSRGSLAKRPSLASRLSSVDRNWLERCQVFGEMEAEEIPGGGNQEVRAKEIQEKEVTGGKAERDSVGERRQSVDSGQEEKLANLARDDTDAATECARRSTGKSKRKDAGEVASVRPPDDEDGGGPKSENAKKKGRKRRRERGDALGCDAEDGGSKKRPRKSKKKEEESSALSPALAGGAEGKKKKTKRKDSAEGSEEAAAKEAKRPPQENILGEIQEEFRTSRVYQPVRARGAKRVEGNFVKINLKKKSHVKGYALRGLGLRKQLYMQKFQLKGERFGGRGGHFGRGWRGGYRGALSRQGDTCYRCGGTGHWALDCKGQAPPPPVSEDPPAEEEAFELPTLEDVARATGTLRPQTLAGSPSVNAEQRQQESGADSMQADEVLLNIIRPDYERPAPPPPVEPLYPPTEDGLVQETPAEVYAALRELGYQSFRPGQEKAIMRILTGLSTLVVLSTGMGKSLCYQLPAYLYAQRSNCITLVISPLVSLMDDQLSGLPAKLKAACIHSNMTAKQREAAIEKVKSGEVCLLLLSPEALVGGGSGSGCLPSAQELPPVAFACIDEAHCVSEWSHNFRPCYLRLCKVLRERLGVKCLLGLTATATLSTALDIAQHLDIRDKDGIAVRSAAVPPNLNLSVSTDGDKDQALVALLKGDRFGCLDSIIVYCTRREETARVAALLRTCLQGVLLKENTQISSNSQTQSNPMGQKKKELARKKIRKPLKWQAEAYHAGLSASVRRSIQNNFMCGQLRIVVATVAFGMGLDKSDVRGIIHYNMPKSFESYVQEIGRAGRDGEPAHCHLFLDSEGGDLNELRRHIYADTVDYHSIKKLVQKVFPACKCKKIQEKRQELWKEIEDADLLEGMDVCDGVTNPAVGENKQGEKQESTSLQVSDLGEGTKEPSESREGEDEAADWQSEQKGESCDWPEERVCHTHERAIPIQETVQALDITEEGVETLLCYLELHPQRFVQLLHPTLSACKVRCYDGPRQLQNITKICPPVAVALARRRMAGERVERLDQVEFDVVEVADTMGWELPTVKRGLRQLQWSTERGGGRSGILVEFSSLSFYFRSYGDLSDEEMDRVCQFLHKRVQDQERMLLYQLTACFKAFKSVAFQSVMSCVDDLDGSRSLQLKNLLSEYFDKRRDGEHTLQPVDLEELDKYKLLDWESQIRADIRSFLCNRSDERFSGRAVARILHGIGSPCYPAQVYGKDRRYWRKYLQFDFNQLIRLATQEILNYK